MLHSFELFAGWRYLKTKKRGGFVSLITSLSMAGVTVGVMTLIVVIAVMSGAEHDFKARVLGSQPHILFMRHGSFFHDYQQPIKKILSVDGVESATPFLHTQVVLRSSSGLAGTLLKGIFPDQYKHVLNNADVLEKSGGKQSAGNGFIPKIILGKALAKELRVEVGQQLIYMLFPRGMQFGVGRLPAMKRFEVAGIFRSGLDDVDKSVAYIHIRDAQKILDAGDAVTGIEVRLKNVEKAKAINQEIRSRLEKAYWSMDWMQMNRNIFSALRLQKTVMFIILILIILVAAFNIAGSLFMMVMERTRDIAILKAMGATAKSIRRIFIFKGMLIGVVGTFTGVCLGALLCIILSHFKFIELPGDVYYFTTLPVRLEVPDIAVIAAAALLICFLSTLYPSNLAARMTPVEGVRTS